MGLEQRLPEAESRRKEHSAEDRPRSFMDVLLSVVPSAELQTDRDAHEVIRAICEAMILGGIDTASVTLIWALSLLLNHPTALKINYEELDNKIGRTRSVNESDLQHLLYLRAAVKETLRLYPPAPLSSPREFSEDYILGRFHMMASEDEPGISQKQPGGSTEDSDPNIRRTTKGSRKKKKVCPDLGH